MGAGTCELLGLLRTWVVRLRLLRVLVLVLVLLLRTWVVGWKGRLARVLLEWVGWKGRLARVLLECGGRKLGWAGLAWWGLKIHIAVFGCRVFFC